MRGHGGPLEKSDFRLPSNPTPLVRGNISRVFSTLLMQSNGSPKRPGLMQAQPKKMKLFSKLVGGKEWKGVKGDRKRWPILEMARHFKFSWRLGRQWVVVAFAALALAAEDNGSGQKEERGGD